MQIKTLALSDASLTLSARIAAYVGALLMVAASTLIGLAIAPVWGTGAVVLLYLPPVLGTAIYGGLAPALVAAAASTLAYNYHFTAPYGTFAIDSPADVVTVLVLFLVAVVTSHLVGSLRDQARLTAAHAARNATIAGFARSLLSCNEEQEIAEQTVHELAGLFDCNAAFVVGEGEPKIVASGPGPAISFTPSDLAAAAHTLQSGAAAGRAVGTSGVADWQFHAIRSDRSVMAAIGLARADGAFPVREDKQALLENLLDQAALALARARLELEARQLVQLRERDALRTALLASIGEDVKPRVHAIATAARALRRAGTSDRAVVDTVASEAARLDRYVDNLLDLAPGADQAPIEIGRLSIDLYRRVVLRDGAEVHMTPKEYAVLAELARHAGRVLSHRHLLRTIWGPAHETQIDYLRVAIRALRLKLEVDPTHPALIVNEPAIGYRLVAPT